MNGPVCVGRRYAPEMQMRADILGSSVGAAQTVASDPASLGAQTEALELLLEWLPRRYPARFRLHRDKDGAVERVQTLSAGYERMFYVPDFTACPLRLMGQLVRRRPVPPRAPFSRARRHPRISPSRSV